LLAGAVASLANAAQHIPDSDLDQPWRWRAHDEGLRFALIGAYHELRDLAVRLASQRSARGLLPTAAQRVLAQHHLAYRDLLAILLGVSEDQYEQEPAPGDWSLRQILTHIVAAQRNFFALVHYGLARQRAGGDQPTRLPTGETDRVVGSRPEFDRIAQKGSLVDLLRFYDALHQRELDEFAAISDAELAGPSLWWEGEEYPLQYRIHRFDAHLRQHTIQVEKWLSAIGQPPNEARQLLRLVYQALAEVEGVLIGAGDLGAAELEETAGVIQEHAAAIGRVIPGARAVLEAAQNGRLDELDQLLTGNSQLAAARNERGISAILLALYSGEPEAAGRLRQVLPELTVFEAAAIGDLKETQNWINDWNGFANEYSRDGFTPLQLACYFGREDVARYLIESGANVTAVAHNSQRIQPLHAAAAGGGLALVRLLLDHGADPNATQQGEFTPLHAAAQNGDLLMAELLLERGADVNALDSHGRSPAAIAAEAGKEEMVSLLHERGGDS
jgi:hypothetical protein